MYMYTDPLILITTEGKIKVKALIIIDIYIYSLSTKKNYTPYLNFKAIRYRKFMFTK